MLAAALLLTSCAPNQVAPDTKPEEGAQCPLLRGPVAQHITLPSVESLYEQDSWMPQYREVAASEPQLAYIVEGGSPKQYVPREQARELAQLVEQVLQEGAGEIVKCGSWHKMWPEVLECFGHATVLKLYYGPTGNHEPLWQTRWHTRLESHEALQSDAGFAVVDVGAVYVLPQHTAEHVSWLVITSTASRDARYINPYYFSADGYSREGTVVAIRLEHTAVVEQIASGLEVIVSQRPTDDEAYRYYAEALEALERGEADAAIQLFEKALLVAHIWPQHDPEFLLALGQARLSQGTRVHDAITTIVWATYMAEEQGQAEVLSRAADLLSAIPDHIYSTPELKRAVLVRLAELRPLDGENWWRLADTYHPAVAIAESVSRPLQGDREKADLYLRYAASLLNAAQRGKNPDPSGLTPLRWDKEEVDLAASYVEKARQIADDVPFGLFLAAVVEGSCRGNYGEALRVLNSALAIEASHPELLRLRQLYAAKAWSRAPGEVWEFAEQGKEYALGGRKWALFSADNRYVAILLLTYSPGSRHQILIVDRTTGEKRVVEADTPEILGWSQDGRWLYYSDRHLFRIHAEHGLPEKLCDDVRWASLSPDGKKIVISKDGLSLLSLDDAQIHRITDDGQHRIGVWYPDSVRLLYQKDTRMPGGDGSPNLTQIAVIDTSGRSAEQILDPEPRHYATLSWVVPGEVLWVVSGWDDLFDVSILPLGGESVRLGELMLGTGTFFAYSSSGLILEREYEQDKAVSFVRLLDTHGHETGRIWLSGFSGNWFMTPHDIGHMAVCARGRHVAYLHYGPEGSSLFLLDLGNGEHTLLLPDADGLLNWSDDGNLLALHSGSTLRVFDVSTR